MFVRSRRVDVSLVSIAVVTASLGFAACGSSGEDGAKQKAGIAGPSEVSLERVSQPTANPFTKPVGKDRKKVRPPKAAVAAGPVTYSGNLAGLYGGTRKSATCDAEQLVTFLTSNPSKATAWASTLGIQTTEISSYVSELTAVVLRTDTRVTNHGFVNGVANPIPALLQAGTAVFVDKYGTPVVKCYCGNPLTAALPLAEPIYTGTPWLGYRPGNVTIINSSTTIINNFRLYDPDTGDIFKRPRGGDGRDDGPYINVVEPLTPKTTPTQPPTPSTTTPPPQPTQPTTPPTPTTTEPAPPPTTPSEPRENPSGFFAPASGVRGQRFTLIVSGFAHNTTVGVKLVRPDGVVENYSINTNEAGDGSYLFDTTGSNTPLGTYTATITNPASGAQTTASVTLS